MLFCKRVLGASYIIHLLCYVDQYLWNPSLTFNKNTFKIPFHISSQYENVRGHSLPLWSRIAPLSANSLTVWRWPCSQATMKGVSLFLPADRGACMLAPCLIRARTASCKWTVGQWFLINLSDEPEKINTWNYICSLLGITPDHWTIIVTVWFILLIRISNKNCNTSMDYGKNKM